MMGCYKYRCHANRPCCVYGPCCPLRSLLYPALAIVWMDPWPCQRLGLLGVNQKLLRTGLGQTEWEKGNHTGSAWYSPQQNS